VDLYEVIMNGTQALSFKDLQTDANDANVLSGVQAQDRRALEKLYLIYYGPLARFLSRIVATSAVEEIINDTFMTVWKCALEFRGESRVAAWIFGILYRTALQSMAPFRLRGRLPFAEILRRHDTEWVTENPYNDRLERRLIRLPLEERVTLALAYQMGFSIDEISAITQVAPATVEMRMFQARRRLRDH
jgi:RNA polymerase sigma-70 factor (ECF subfamily)